MDERLVALRQGAANVDEAQRKRIEADYEKFRKAWRVRKKMVYEVRLCVCVCVFPLSNNCDTL